MLWTLEVQGCWRGSLAAAARCGYCTGHPVDLDHVFHSGGAGTVWSQIHPFRKKSTGVWTSDSLWQQTRRVGGRGEDGGRLGPWDGRMFLCFVHNHSGCRGATLSLIVTSPCGLSPSFHPCIVLEHHNFICCSYKEARSTMKSRLQNVRCMSTKET